MKRRKTRLKGKEREIKRVKGKRRDEIKLEGEEKFILKTCDGRFDSDLERLTGVYVKKSKKYQLKILNNLKQNLK